MVYPFSVFRNYILLLLPWPSVDSKLWFYFKCLYLEKKRQNSTLVPILFFGIVLTCEYKCWGPKSVSYVCSLCTCYWCPGKTDSLHHCLQSVFDCFFTSVYCFCLNISFINLRFYRYWSNKETVSSYSHN